MIIACYLFFPYFYTNIEHIGDNQMEKKRYIYWQEEDMWVGYLEEYPDYMTQGETLEELKENLIDIYKDLTNGAVPHVRKAAELEVA